MTRAAGPATQISRVRGSLGSNDARVCRWRSMRAALKTLGASSGAFAVRAEPRAACAGPGQSLGHHDVDVDAVRAEPATRVNTWREAARSERVSEQWRVCELAGSDRQVRIGRVLGDCEFGVGRVEIDRLRTDEDERVEVLFKRVERVEERSAGPKRKVGQRRQARSFPFIQSSSSSPADGMRPEPVSRSAAAWLGATIVSPSTIVVRS
jgi:hypothetical protein